ncbi:MAG TPA: hypothetical protein VJ797_15590 [Burkholderiales bacterium]|nr:hypothetical protein [Burkholderiales bacterium]
MWGSPRAHTEAELVARRQRRTERRARWLALARLAAPELRDVVFVAGLAALFYGLWLERPALAWIVCGALLIALVVLRRPTAPAKDK